MNFFVLAALFAGAFAVPTQQNYPGVGGNPTTPGNGGNPSNPGNPGNGGGSGSPYVPCVGSGLLQSSAQCCATDVLGVANLNCAPPPEFPTSPSDFQSICATRGQQPSCCLLPILGQGLVCTKPVGIS